MLRSILLQKMSIEEKYAMYLLARVLCTNGYSPKRLFIIRKPKVIKSMPKK